MSLRVCTVPGCAELVQSGRCAAHQRGTSAQRGYGGKGHKRFRSAVLARDPICVVCRVKRSTDADHYPRDRQELVRLGLNPNDPAYGRGLCHGCHSRSTVAPDGQPGWWNDRNTPDGVRETPFEASTQNREEEKTSAGDQIGRTGRDDAWTLS